LLVRTCLLDDEIDQFPAVKIARPKTMPLIFDSLQGDEVSSLVLLIDLFETTGVFCERNYGVFFAVDNEYWYLMLC